MEETKRRRFIIRAVLEGEVDVHEEPGPQYVTSGLVHRWDAIDNTRSGHNASATSWEDLIGTSDLVMNNSTYNVWGDDYLEFLGNNAQYLDAVGAQLTQADPYTVEAVIESTSPNTAQKVIFVGTPNRSINLYGGDKTFSMNGASSKTYQSGVTSITAIRSLSAVYDANAATGSAYCNGVPATLGNTIHSLTDSKTDRIRIAVTSSNTPDYFFKGKIHAIRIYDRQLTAAEIAQNYAVDQERFGF